MKWKGLLLFIGLLFLTYMLPDFFDYSLPPKVTSENILKIKPGMSLEQVEAILGRPLSISTSTGLHIIGCTHPNFLFSKQVDRETDIRKSVRNQIHKKKYCCENNREDLKKMNQITLVYTEAHSIGDYPMLWVHLDSTFKVNIVYAKQYEKFLGNDPGIYGSDHTGNWMNEEKFYDCFK